MKQILKAISDKIPDFIINNNVRGFAIFIEGRTVKIEITFKGKLHNFYYSHLLSQDEYIKVHDQEMFIDSIFNCMEYQIEKLRSSEDEPN